MPGSAAAVESLVEMRVRILWTAEAGQYGHKHQYQMGIDPGFLHLMSPNVLTLGHPESSS